MHDKYDFQCYHVVSNDNVSSLFINCTQLNDIYSPYCYAIAIVIGMYEQDHNISLTIITYNAPWISYGHHVGRIILLQSIH